MLFRSTLLQTGAPEKWRPQLEGNTYVQNNKGLLAGWPNQEGYQTNYAYYYDQYKDTVTEVIRDILGDESGKVLKNTK